MVTLNEHTIHFPKVEAIEQGEEYVFVEQDGNREKVRFHDYDKIYEVPGLYEYLFYDRYKCNSPEVVCNLLKNHLRDRGSDESGFKVLDVGAGNGMVGEQLSIIGADTIVGIDIIEQAKAAVLRDRPDVYKEYHIADLTDIPSKVEDSLSKFSFNCMTVVAALGFGDIPPQAFAGGFDMVAPQGWVAFNIKEDFVADDDRSGFSRLIGRLESNGVLDLQEKHRYRHRFCQDGDPLYYYAVIGQKCGEIEEAMLTGLDA
jgi:hypothetical protein